MNPDQIEGTLREGIEAAKSGNKIQARELFLAVVAADQRNELAWLWLSSVVETIPDKQVCLENVLAINPDNEAAKRGLERLISEKPNGDVATETITNDGTEEYIVRRTYKPLTPASAILYPRQETIEWGWEEPALQMQEAGPSFRHESQFDDVWEREGELCAYCAAEVSQDDNRCRNCRQKLIGSHYRYNKPSADLVITMVMIIGVAQISFVLVLLNLIVVRSVTALVWHTLVFGGMIVIAIGMNYRRFWAYIASIIALFMMVVVHIFNYLARPEVIGILDEQTTREFFLALAENPLSFIAEPLLEFLAPVQLIAALLAIFFVLFRVGPEFERVFVRHTAGVDKGLSDASSFYARGKAYADHGMWANTVLHYQRATALDPQRSFYQRELGEAYARLGFYERGLDVLESARRIEADPGRKADISIQIDQLKGQVLIKGSG